MTEEQKELLKEVCVILNEVWSFDIPLSMYNKNWFLERDWNEYDLWCLVEDLNISFWLECDL